VQIPVHSDDLVEYATACCSVLQCVAVCCSVLQCVAVCCRLGNTGSPECKF